MEWHYQKENRFWYTKGTDGTYLAMKVPFRDTIAWKLLAMENKGDWFDFGRFITADQAKGHAATLQREHAQ